MANAPAIAFAPTQVAKPASDTLPWFIYVLVGGSACIPLGVLWDISWHSTIGRDTFWTPAHMMTHIGGLIPGLTCGWLALKTHFWASEEERGYAVTFWGFRAPLGCWVTIWGTFTMLISAPFDNWWHDAYGLDVQILSPPHSLLALGMFAVNVGVLLLMLSLQNRSGLQTAHTKWLFIFTGGVLLLMSAIFLTEESFPNSQHSGRFYLHSTITYPLYLIAASRASKMRWPATILAGVYMALTLAMGWILPLFHGEPKLAPIYNPVTHMVPPAFPLLLIVPAFGLDLLMHRFRNVSGWWRNTLLAALLSVLFALLFIGTQWKFSEFLLTPAADNWFFIGNRYWWYFSHPGDWMHEFWHDRNWPKDPLTPGKFALALGFAFLSTRLGLSFGAWMSRVKR
ncbi:MAG TPA: hypothetical protein VMZ27_05290 [Candidatus Saccharimonadales bacterium]|nr:hypothetical protein [Candidatus Saccharimonadales bacterium]